MKLLKGLYAKNNPDNPIAPKIHNLILLSQKANLEVPTEIREKIQTINTFIFEEVRKWLKEQ